MIRVLHFAGIINRHDFIDTVLCRLDRSRFELSALTGLPARRSTAQGEEEAYSTRCLDIPATRPNYPALLRELVTEIKRFRPHIVHAHHFNESLIAAAAARWLRLPCLVIGHHYSDHIYFLSKGLRRRAHLALEAFTNRTASSIVVPARDVARILTERQGVPAAKVRAIPYGLESDRYRPSSPEAPGRLREQAGLTGKYVILTCCRLNREKGLDYFLRAIPDLSSRHSDFEVLMVGDGPLRAELVGLARRLGIEGLVRFMGWRDDALDWMATADVVVQPSLCESYGQVLVEALAFGKPVVMTPVGAAPEIIGQDERGLLVRPADSRHLSNVLGQLMTDRALGIRLGDAGRRYVKQHMRPDLISRQHEELYERELDGTTSYEIPKDRTDR